MDDGLLDDVPVFVGVFAEDAVGFSVGVEDSEDGLGLVVGGVAYLSVEEVEVYDDDFEGVGCVSVFFCFFAPFAECVCEREGCGGFAGAAFFGGYGDDSSDVG